MHIKLIKKIITFFKKISICFERYFRLTFDLTLNLIFHKMILAIIETMSKSFHVERIKLAQSFGIKFCFKRK